MSFLILTSPVFNHDLNRRAKEYILISSILSFGETSVVLAIDSDGGTKTVTGSWMMINSSSGIIRSEFEESPDKIVELLAKILREESEL